MLINENIVRQHATEASFLWTLRDRAVVAPHWFLSDITKHDRRLEANLIGLLLAKQRGLELTREELDRDCSGDAFVSAYLAYMNGSRDLLEETFEQLAIEPELIRGVISALAWMNEDRAVPLIQDLVNSTETMCTLIGLGGLSARRIDIPLDWKGLFSHSDPRVRSKTIQLAGKLGKIGAITILEQHLQEDDCLESAAIALTLLGAPSGTRALGELAISDRDSAEVAADLVTRRHPDGRILSWWRQLISSNINQRIPIRIARAIGDPAVLPWLIEQMSADAVSRLAGHAFASICGIDLAYDDLDKDPPENLNDESEESLYIDIEKSWEDPDADLPWPDPVKVATWYNENRYRFTTGQRFFLGKCLDRQVLHHAIRNSNQWDRASAALELKLSDPQSVLFEVRSRGDQQEKLLT